METSVSEVRTRELSVPEKRALSRVGMLIVNDSLRITGDLMAVISEADVIAEVKVSDLAQAVPTTALRQLCLRVHGMLQNGFTKAGLEEEVQRVMTRRSITVKIWLQRAYPSRQQLHSVTEGGLSRVLRDGYFTGLRENIARAIKQCMSGAVCRDRAKQAEESLT